MCLFVVSAMPFIYLRRRATSVSFVYPQIMWTGPGSGSSLKLGLGLGFGTYLRLQWRGAVHLGPGKELWPGPGRKPPAAGGKPQRKMYPFRGYFYGNPLLWRCFAVATFPEDRLLFLCAL